MPAAMLTTSVPGARGSRGFTASRICWGFTARTMTPAAGAPAAARTLALAPFAGAAKLARERAEDPAVLRAQVTSKGGTTERALATMEAAGLKDRIVEAVKAAAARSRELGDEFGRG